MLTVLVAQEHAARTIPGVSYKGRLLEVGEAKRRKFQDKTSGSHGSDTKDPALALADGSGKGAGKRSIHDAVTPLWQQPYGVQLQNKLHTFAQTLRKLTRKVRKTLKSGNSASPEWLQVK